MSGSRSSSGWTPAESPGVGSDPCDLRFQTELFSPVPSVIQGLNVGDRLMVQLITRGQSQSVAALTKSTEAVAGTIVAASQLGVLISCLAQHNYEAEVRSISGSKVTVIIERV